MSFCRIGDHPKVSSESENNLVLIEFPFTIIDGGYECEYLLINGVHHNVPLIRISIAEAANNDIRIGKELFDKIFNLVKEKTVLFKYIWGEAIEMVGMYSARDKIFIGDYRFVAE